MWYPNTWKWWKAMAPIRVRCAWALRNHWQSNWRVAGTDCTWRAWTQCSAVSSHLCTYSAQFAVWSMAKREAISRRAWWTGRGYRGHYRASRTPIPYKSLTSKYKKGLYLSKIYKLDGKNMHKLYTSIPFNFNLYRRSTHINCAS